MARCTDRLTGLLRDIGFEVSAESARRILAHMRVVTSGDTVLRVVKRTLIATDVSPRVVGLDDWAIRKGHRYGSMMVDHETDCVIDLVKGRLAEDIQP